MGFVRLINDYVYKIYKRGDTRYSFHYPLFFTSTDQLLQFPSPWTLNIKISPWPMTWPILNDQTTKWYYYYPPLFPLPSIPASWQNGNAFVPNPRSVPSLHFHTSGMPHTSTPKVVVYFTLAPTVVPSNHYVFRICDKIIWRMPSRTYTYT